MTVPASLSKWAHPRRSNTPSSSSRAPGPCITPSTETCVVVVSFMIVVPFLRSAQTICYTPVNGCLPTGVSLAARQVQSCLRPCRYALSELLGESDEKSFGAADVAEPIRVFVLDHFT